MAFVHGKGTVITVDSDDISAFTNTSAITRARDTHDVTAYGADAHEFSGGLGNNTFTMGGVYDSTASTGSRAVLQPIADAGVAVEITRKPEGTGSGKPLETFDAILTSYVETSPVADMVTWQADWQISGEIVTTSQGA